MPKENLMEATLACLGNNMMFDAAMAAIAATVLNSARENDEVLRDPKNYRVDPVRSEDVHVRCTRAGVNLSIGDIHKQVGRLEDTVAYEWRTLLERGPERVLWNTVRLALHATATLQWDVYLVYMTVNKEQENG